MVFGKLAGENAAEYAKSAGTAAVSEADVKAAAADALAPFDRDDSGEGPFQLQQALQDMMQDKVGIIRDEAELDEAVEALSDLRNRAAKVKVHGNREWNSGWHTALDLEPLLTVSEAVALAARERKESRGAHTRNDYQEKDPEWGKANLIVEKADDGSMRIRREDIEPVPERLAKIIEEQG